MDELKKKIKSWLEKQGYPLEMYVAKKFKENGFDIGQSVYYRDLETEKSREIDVIAFNYTYTNGVWFNLAFVVECKMSKDKPWIVFKNEDLLSERQYIRKRFATKNGKLLINSILERNEDDQLMLIGKKLNTSGYAVTQAFTQGQDITYAALNGVTKSIQYFISETDKSERKLCTIYFPLVVIDGELFESKLDKYGEIELEEIEQSNFIWIKSFDTNSLIQVTILTKKSLDEYIRNLKLDCQSFFKVYKDEIKLISKSYPINSRI